MLFGVLSSFCASVFTVNRVLQFSDMHNFSGAVVRYEISGGFKDGKPVRIV